jgi:hypothetical protein
MFVPDDEESSCRIYVDISPRPAAASGETPNAKASLQKVEGTEQR